MTEAKRPHHPQRTDVEGGAAVIGMIFMILVQRRTGGS